MDWKSFRFIDLFAGIGGIRLGFESVGGKCVFSSEFDEDACKTYEANFGEHPAGEGEGRRQIREELVSEGVFIFVTTCSLQNPGDGGCWEDV